MSEACDACGDAASDALARTVSLSVDGSKIDSQRLCPDCFAEWINRYEAEMRTGANASDDDADIIVD